MPECPTPQEIRRALSGDIDETRYLTVFDHLNECPQCSAVAAECDIPVPPEFLPTVTDPAGTTRSPKFIDRIKHELPGGRDESPSSVDLASGQQFAGYEILDRIARGGMGVVFRARQTSLNREVALKVILAGEFASDEATQRFQTEAEAAARLDHPHVVRVYEFGRQQKRHFLAMELIEGGTLKSRLADGPMSSRDAAAITRTIAEAVAYAHGRGVIHRDLKPSNVLFDDDGQPHVADFGLAKRLDVDSELTATGAVVGTPAYMPPEQAAGRHADVGRHSDVYSLGAVLYHLLVGRPPFQAATPFETIQQVLTQEPFPPRQLDGTIDRDVETIVLKCLQKTPSQRYMSAEDLAADLQRYVNGEPILARPIGRPARLWRWCRRNRLATGLILSIFIGLVGTTVGFVATGVQWSRAEDNYLIAEERYTALQLERERVQQNYELARRGIDEISLPLGVPRGVGQMTEIERQQELLKSHTDAALHINSEFIRRNADAPEHEEDVAQSWLNVGDVRYAQASATHCLTAYGNAILLFERLHARRPNDPAIVVRLAFAHYRRGSVLDKVSRRAESRAAYAKSTRLQEKLAAGKDAPSQATKSGGHDAMLVASYATQLASFALEEERFAAAAQIASLAVRAIESSAANTSRPDLFRRGTSWAYYIRGLANDKLGRYDEAIADLQRVGRLDPAQWQSKLNLAYACLHKGEHKGATDAVNALANAGLARNHPSAAMFVYAAAAVHSRAIRELKADKTVTDAQREQIARKYLAQSWAWFQKYIARPDVDDKLISGLLATDNDLHALKATPGFRAWLASRTRSRSSASSGRK